MLDQLLGLQIEPTNMCTLKCPRCSRTEFIKQFPKKWTNKNLNLEHLKRFLDIDLSGKLIHLSGNYGDPIYYDQLFDLIEYFKEAGGNILISTNGSYRNKDWWTKLNQLLNENDQIIFAIDGIPENFTKYRINADWPSIQQGVEILNQGTVKKDWQYIRFSYNENNIDQARQLSESMGFNKFYVKESDRWDNGTEWLTPSIVNTISQSKINWKKDLNSIEVAPNCKKTNIRHYISADGYYAPCSYSVDHRFYYKSEFYKNKDMYDISKTTITEVLTHLKDFYSTLEDAKLNYCTFSCPKL